MYWDIVKTVFEPKGIKVQIVTVPWKRAVYEVTGKDIDALVGDYYYPEKAGKEYLYPKWHVSVEDTMYIVFKRSMIKDWDSKKLKAFNNKTVAWTRGYGFEKTIFSGINVRPQEITKVSSGMGMLQKERVDALVDYKLEILPTAKARSMDLKKDYRMEVAHLGNQLFVVFSNTEKSKKLAKIFDQRMSILSKSGKIVAIYEKWGFDKDKFGAERFGIR